MRLVERRVYAGFLSVCVLGVYLVYLEDADEPLGILLVFSVGLDLERKQSLDVCPQLVCSCSLFAGPELQRWKVQVLLKVWLPKERGAQDLWSKVSWITRKYLCEFGYVSHTSKIL